MVPGCQRTSRKSPSVTVYTRKTRKTETRTNKATDLPYQKACSATPETDRTVGTLLPSSPRAARPRSSSTTKRVQPGKASKRSRARRISSLPSQQQEQRQALQKQLQQIRAIRRKRTVAFAVNPERVSRPHSACVVSVVAANSAPECHNSSSAQLIDATRNTVDSSKNNGVKNSTVTRDLRSSRAGRAIPNSTSTFQRDTNSSNNNIIIDANDVEYLKRGTQEEQMVGSEPLPSTLIRDSSIEDIAEQKDNDYDTTDRNHKLPTIGTSHLVVDVRSAEKAAAAIPNHITSTTCGCPVPVTPNYLPCSHESNCAAENATTKMRRMGRPSKNSKLCTNHETEISRSSCNPPSAANYSKLSTRIPKIKRVRYDMELVPFVEINKDLLRETRAGNAPGSPKSVAIPSSDDKCNSLLKGSVLWVPSSRQEWEETISEMKSVCTSAAFRRWSKNIIRDYDTMVHQKNFIRNNDDNLAKTRSANPVNSPPTPAAFHPPLAQAFIKDRVQIDDPLKGYQIRHVEGGWLQGFLVWTNFTVWTQDFQWNSQHPSSGLSQHHGSEPDGRSVAATDDGTLSGELQALPRGAQDPLDGGIVLKQVAEISLLGGLGCGEVLLRKALEDMRRSKDDTGKPNYKYVVLQATEGSRRFYEKMGFVRVGAICRYRWAEYCTNSKTGSPEKAGKKSETKTTDGIHIAPNTTFDPPPTYHGYRHWTYTNESSKSLNLHGGPSIMMCLKLDEDNEDKKHAQQRTVSTLLKPHLVDEKPVIQLSGNVANPNSENIAPTRKSKRQHGSGRLGCPKDEEEHEQGQKTTSHPASSIGATDGIFAPTIPRRTSNRSKRGRNKALANSDYVVYGVKGDWKNSCENRQNRTDCSNIASKRRRRTERLNCDESLLTVDANKVSFDEAVDVSLDTTKRESGGTVTRKEVSSMKSKGKRGWSALESDPYLIVTTNDTLLLRKSYVRSRPEKFSDVRSPPSATAFSSYCREGSEHSNDIAECNQDHNASAESKNSASEFEARSLCQCTNGDVICLDDKKSLNSPNPKEKKDFSGPRRVSFTKTCVQGSISTQDLVCMDKNCTETFGAKEDQLKTNRDIISYVGDPSIVACEKSGEISDLCSDDLVSDPSRPKKRRSITVKKTDEPSPSSARQQDAKRPEQRDTVRHRVIHSGHEAPIVSRKRSRKPILAIDKSKLTHGINEKGSSSTDFCNKVVIRRNVRSALGGSIGGTESGNENPKKSRIRWHYNGGLMINHRCEFCYYYVLHSNEVEKTLTIVPMIKDGVFEEKTDIQEMTLDESVIGRPRYECNILKTDKNWIHDAPMEEYVIVPEAVPVINTPLVAQEAWDILQDN